jgi:hypothetical protein
MSETPRTQDDWSLRQAARGSSRRCSDERIGTPRLSISMSEMNSRFSCEAFYAILSALAKMSKAKDMPTRRTVVDDGPPLTEQHL